MTETSGTSGSGASSGGAPGNAADLTAVLGSRGYHALLLGAAVLGLPIAIVAFGFLAATTSMQTWVWKSLPAHFGWDQPKAWYAVLVLGLAGLLVGVVVTRLPGRGGHLPANGMGGGMTQPVDLSGVLLAAVLSLVLGAVLGPEAPLIALGGGLAILVANRTRLRESQQGVALIAAAGSTAAIATVFGNPLVAAVLMLEVVGFAGRQVLLVLLPCLVSSGIGALIFTGLGNWTGIKVSTLTIPGLPASALDVGDLLWVIPVAVAASIGAHLCRQLGLQTARACATHTLWVTTAAGLLVGAAGAAYTLATGRSVLEVLESGEGALPGLVSTPKSWSIISLLLLLVFKGAGYGLSLGSFRGGPTFPAVFLGAVIGVLTGPLPGLGTTAAIAIGMTATTTAVLRLPVTSIVLVVLLLGNEGISQLPVIMVAAVAAMITAVALDTRGAGAESGPQGGSPGQGSGPASE